MRGTMTKKNPVKKAAKRAAKKSPAKEPHPLKAVAEAVAATKPDVDPEHARREDAARRAQACDVAIQDALKTHRCQLHPFFDPPEAVGAEPVGKVILTANVQVIPYA